MLFFSLGCEDGYIDDINSVDPGPDETAPVVEINFPAEDIVIPFTEEATDLNFRFQVADDIEIQSISITLNGSELESYTDFPDYRKAVLTFMYEDLPVGDYTFDVTAVDRAGKSTEQSVSFVVTNVYPAKEGEIFYMPFEGEAYLELISGESATVVGNPGFAEEGVSGSGSYAGAEGSYLTFPTEGLLNEEFSAAFWYNVNASPDRAGILTVSAIDEINPDMMNNRTKGFRLFREGGAANQTIKLNVGTGEGESWFDGGPAATIDPTASDWVHIAFTISATEAKVYIDGDVVSQGEFDGVDWTGTDLLTIGSGAPRFVEWNHLSDLSYLDDLRIFNKVLEQAEIQAMIEEDTAE